MRHYNKEKRMKILITGGSGYVGSNIAAWLKQNTDFRVIGIYNSR